MISQAVWWTRNPSATLLQPKNWNAHFWIMFTLDDQPGWSMDSNPIHHLSPANKMKCSYFALHSTSDDQPGSLMDLNPIHHLSPAKKMKCTYFDYVQLLMIGWAGQWTQTPSTTPLHPKKWIVHFWITFNFWWLAGLVNGLKLPQPALSSQKNEMLLFALRSTSDDQLGWSMYSNPILHLSPAKEMKCYFLYYV